MRSINMRRSMVAAVGAAVLVVGTLVPSYAAPVSYGQDVPGGDAAVDVPAVKPIVDPEPNPNPAPAPKPSWKKDSVGWWYDLDNGSFVRDEKREIDGSTYRFDSRGYMVTGWHNTGSAWEYYAASGVQALGWTNVSGTWYYLDMSTGVMRTGWTTVDGSWYYPGALGAMVTGWMTQDGAWYYLNASGVAVTGWNAIGGSWYHFNTSGAMATGWMNQGGTWYYFDSSGVMVTGTQWISGERHWFYDSGAWWGLYPVPSGSGGSGSADAATGNRYKAICHDGFESFSAPGAVDYRGMCAGHGGIARKLGYGW